MIQHAIGLDIGGTKTTLSLAGYDDQEPWASLDLLAERVLPTGEGTVNPSILLTQCFPIISKFLKNFPSSPIGISIGGPLDRDSGRVLSPPHLPGWVNTPLVDQLVRRFHTSVYMEHDGLASALAEWHWGAGRGSDNMVYLTYGTGLGAGLVLARQPYRGQGFAGEIGQIRTRETSKETYELYCSGAGMRFRARENGFAESDCDPRKLADSARKGNKVARKLFEDSAHHLGQLLALLVNVLSPDCIVIGGIFVYQYDLLWPLAEEFGSMEALRKAWKQCRIVPAGLGGAVGSYAAIAGLLEFMTRGE